MTVEELKEKARAGSQFGCRASWHETGERLIHCALKDDGSFVFRNTTSATERGPIISEKQAAEYLRGA